jgi:hypothetical protein
MFGQNTTQYISEPFLQTAPRTGQLVSAEIRTGDLEHTYHLEAQTFWSKFCTDKHIWLAADNNATHTYELVFFSSQPDFQLSTLAN